MTARDLRAGDRVRTPGGEEGVTIDVAPETQLALVLLDRDRARSTFTFAVGDLRRYVDIKEEMGTAVAGELEALRLTNARAIAALKQAEDREDVRSIVLELVPELVELLGKVTMLPPEIRRIVEQMATKLARVALSEE